MIAPPQCRDDAADTGIWGRPTDLTAYDREPRLTVGEQAALAEVQRRRERRASGGLWPRELYGALQRLLTPLRDVLAATEATLNDRGVAIGLLLAAIHRRQLTWWGWTRDEWRAVLEGEGHSRASRQHVMAVAYLLCGHHDLHVGFARFKCRPFADKLFGRATVDATLRRVAAELRRWGYTETFVMLGGQQVVCALLLIAHSPRLEDITPVVMNAALGPAPPRHAHRAMHAISRALTGLGVLAAPVAGPSRARKRPPPATATGVPATWAYWCDRWRATSTLSARSRQTIYYNLLKVGRWLAARHPEVTAPGQWTRELAAEYVATVDRMAVGEWSHAVTSRPERAGQPLGASAKAHHIGAMRTFLRDGIEWGWFPRRLDPGRSLATPRAIRARLGPSPRTIADDVWAKLLWAGLNLTADDLSANAQGVGGSYPLPMVRAVAIAWLFSGLRSDELRRLRIGCIEWQREDVNVPGTGRVLARDAVCRLHVPVNKTASAFTKPVDYVVGEAIVAWEGARPPQTSALDSKTGEPVQFLFSCHNRRLGKSYLNRWLIPLLCRKAGVPTSDARGPITSHRARSTIASQLANAKEPLTLLELKQWLGHRHVETTLRYLQTTPTKLAQAYADAGYFARNLRAVEVLIDQEAVRSGAASRGEPWKHYDLGHGYCTYDFFEQCPHRMACAKCAFYVPKGATAAVLLEGRGNLVRMRQEIPLSEEERAAVDEGIAAHEGLLAKLADVPTPAGPTPRELGPRADSGAPSLPAATATTPQTPGEPQA